MTHSYKPFILIIIISLGIIVGVSALYYSARTYQVAKDIKTQKITPTPTPEAPIIRDVKEEVKRNEQQILAEPGNLDLLKSQASSFLLLGENEKSINTYLQAIQLTPQDADLYVGLGDAHVQANSTSQAIEAYEMAMSLDPQLIHVYVQLANIYTIKQPDRTNVIDTYIKGIQSNPNNILLRILFSSFYEQIQEKELALEQYQRVLQIDPTNSIAIRKIEQLSK